MNIPLILENYKNSISVRDGADGSARLENRYIDIESVRSAVEKIKKRFYLTETEEHEFIMEFPGDDKNSINTFIGFFIQAISIIGNLDIIL